MGQGSIFEFTMLAKHVKRKDLKQKIKNNLSVILESDESEEIESIKKPLVDELEVTFSNKVVSKEE